MRRDSDREQSKTETGGRREKGEGSNTQLLHGVCSMAGFPRNLLFEIRGVRNRWAHQELFNNEVSE